MVDILTTVTSAIGLSKKLLDIATLAKDAQAKMAIADLQIQLAEIKTQLAELIEENLRLKQALKAKGELPSVTLRDELYYTEDGDGPFCTCCFDSSKQLIRVAAMPKVFEDLGKWRCPKCESKVGGLKL